MTLGNDFSRYLTLNILPGINLGHNYYIIMIDVSTKDGSYYNNANMIMGNPDLHRIGCDVYSLRVIVTQPHGVTTTSNFHMRYEMRVDQLLLLNMALKLLGRPLTPEK